MSLPTQPHALSPTPRLYQYAACASRAGAVMICRYTCAIRESAHSMKAQCDGASRATLRLGEDGWRIGMFFFLAGRFRVKYF
jgi:hypothetical protein